MSPESSDPDEQDRGRETDERPPTNQETHNRDTDDRTSTESDTSAPSATENDNGDRTPSDSEADDVSGATEPSAPSIADDAEQLLDAEELVDADAPLDADAMAAELVDRLPERTPSPDRTGAQLPVSVDDTFEVLADPGNRFVLTYLLRVEDPASYDDLVEYVVQRASAPDDLTDAKFRGRIAARLVHTNLPALAEAGFVDHDSQRQHISSTRAVDGVAPYLALAMWHSSTADGSITDDGSDDSDTEGSPEDSTATDASDDSST